ncbi:hypothetical protein B0H13DRAFT_2368517 [Mycena leptocephala]|nr:hypothetical protein B0H13DRAFT_2368517 [Mycena leptocephala]
MPRKAAAANDPDDESLAAGGPRRSSRIKELPKVEVPVKRMAKPHAEEGDEDKPKRGRKRKRLDAENGDSNEAAPAANNEALAAKNRCNAVAVLKTGAPGSATAATPLVDASQLHISGGTFTQVAGHHMSITSKETCSTASGISILERNISGDAFYNSEQRFPPPHCHPDTRVAVQSTIHAWAEEGNQAPSVMWLYGPAGAGKSAVAQTMAENGPQKTDLLLPSSSQDGERAGLRTPIGVAVEADPAICNKNLEDQARALIVNPLKELDVEAHKPYLVIIDGLDECNGKPMQSRIVTIIFRDLVKNRLPIRFLICSRPEPNIRETFNSLLPTAHFRRLGLDETFDPGRDILHYLRYRFSEIQRTRFPYDFGTGVSWPSERELESLVQKASGQFIYATTVIKFVDDEFCHPVEQLKLVLDLSSSQTSTSVFVDLDTLYSFILATNPNVSLLVQILGAYFGVRERNSCLSFLDDIVGLVRGSARFALRGVHSVLFIPDSDDQQIRVHHASLYDFLSSPTRARGFFLDMNHHHKALARVVSRSSGILYSIPDVASLPSWHMPIVVGWIILCRP